MTLASLPLSLEFRLTGAGWADLHVATTDAAYVVEGISYCTQALDDLLLLAIRMALLDCRAAATFDGEPVLTTLEIERQAGAWVDAACTLRCWKRHRDEQQVLFEFEVASADMFAAAVLEMTERLLERHGADGYEALWSMSPFPTRGLAALRAALTTPQRPWRWKDDDD